MKKNRTAAASRRLNAATSKGGAARTRGGASHRSPWDLGGSRPTSRSRPPRKEAAGPVSREGSA